MNNPTRMSPLTAFFAGLFGCASIAIAAVTIIVLDGMKMADRNISNVTHLAKQVIDGLPEIMDSLPSALADALHDRRDPAYATSLETKVQFVEDGRGDGVRPVLDITNKGDRVVSMLGIRVAAMNDRGVPVRDWTEVVATPIAINDDWRGPLFPHETRHVVLRRGMLRGPSAGTLKGEIEVCDIRVWEAEDRTGAAQPASFVSSGSSN
ncbi:MAG: hypothetical protein HY287_03265 [Planctomycetes bacterium]|nr:hypothetical protein [Planctomycetota bacterium]MBI3833331.1 hypothetical protein [Planctomycetota bacterium]